MEVNGSLLLRTENRVQLKLSDEERLHNFPNNELGVNMEVV